MCPIKKFNFFGNLYIETVSSVPIEVITVVNIQSKTGLHDSEQSYIIRRVEDNFVINFTDVVLSNSHITKKV
jgi:hypothetical protein